MKFRTSTWGLAAIAALAASVAVAGGVALQGPAPDDAGASSHREAPLISEDPSADNTDLYAFRDKNAPRRVNIIANWYPAEDTAAGPMYYTFSEGARYWIKIDNTGDGRADIRYRYVFKKPGTLLFLRKTVQDYRVTKFVGNRAVYSRNMRTAPNYTGPRSVSTTGSGQCNEQCFRDRAKAAVKTMPDRARIFAGQRDDAFFGDIGQIFDNLSFRKGTGGEGGGKDFFAGYAVHSISMQVPITRLTRKGRPTIGVWASTERRQVVVNRRTGRASSRWVQVSRIGNPLFNEVVVPTTSKDGWNARDPHRDSAYVKYTQTPMLAAAINLFYPGVVKAPEKNRKDLTAIFLTGLPKLNFTGNVKADMLRLNTSIPPAETENRMAVLAGDNAGWPNGRRLGDDVIDIALQAVAGATHTPSNPRAAGLGDGVNGDDRPLLFTFPYQADPAPGAANVKGEQKP